MLFEGESSGDWFVGYAGSAAVIVWIPYRLLWLVVRTQTQTPRLAQLAAGRGTDPTSPTGLSPAAL